MAPACNAKIIISNPVMQSQHNYNTRSKPDIEEPAPKRQRILQKEKSDEISAEEYAPKLNRKKDTRTAKQKKKLTANVEQRTADLPQFKKHDVVHFADADEEYQENIFWCVEKTMANYQYTIDKAQDSIFRAQNKLRLVNVNYDPKLQGFTIGLAEYKRVRKLVSLDSVSSEEEEESGSGEDSVEAIISPTKVLSSQLNKRNTTDDRSMVAAKPAVETTDQFGFTFDKIASKDLEPKHFIGVYIYWLNSFGYFHPQYSRDQLHSGKRSFLIPYMLQRIVPVFASAPFEDVADPEKQDLLRIYSSTIDSTAYRVLKYPIPSGEQFREVIGIGKTKSSSAYQHISSYSGIVRFANGAHSSTNTAYLFVPPLFPSDQFKTTFPMKKKK